MSLHQHAMQERFNAFLSPSWRFYENRSL